MYGEKVTCNLWGNTPAPIFKPGPSKLKGGPLGILGGPRGGIWGLRRPPGSQL